MRVICTSRVESCSCMCGACSRLCLRLVSLEAKSCCPLAFHVMQKHVSRIILTHDYSRNSYLKVKFTCADLMSENSGDSIWLENSTGVLCNTVRASPSHVCAGDSQPPPWHFPDSTDVSVNQGPATSVTQRLERASAACLLYTSPSPRDRG